MNFQNIVRSAGDIKSAQANMRAAEEQVDTAMAKMKAAVVSFFEGAPEGTTVQNRALAQMCEMTPSAMARLLYNPASANAPYKDDSELVTTRYAEIDESGNLVPGGAVTTKRRYLVTYTRK